MRVLVAIIFGLIIGALFGLVGGYVISILVLLFVRYGPEPRQTANISIAFQAIWIALLGLPIGAITGVIVGAARPRPWYERLLLGVAVGLGLSLVLNAYLAAGTLSVEVGLTFAIVCGLLGIVQTTATALVENFAGYEL